MVTSEVVYPYIDLQGYMWVDPSGFLLDEGSCFICSKEISRVDINFESYFCNSYACNLTIEFALKEMSVVKAVS